MVIALNEKIVRYQKRIGLQGYEGLPFGTYLIRINEKTFKIQLSKYPQGGYASHTRLSHLHISRFFTNIAYR